ncbi:PAP2 superfamily protein [Janthinobacterium agaricidamnosum NBRC 102515 = DSM 9628]|uniref:PAP2 superfamily protein n=1 Tax=Janthinobacterium agaricidamnosum NBRC 102515 = DSM 9628 TaxID=1349767 RepID=W0V871_9BURK|nr:PAP2 superfamily protein [Janthinobacterium agaricidamnosum NBRC 102515 = DSM 9628]
MVGSVAVTAPAGIAIALWLVAAERWRLALNWCLWYGGGMALVVITKVAFIGWGLGISSIGFAGFSGHAMRAAAVFPVAFFVLRMNAGGRQKYFGVLLGAILAVLISVSRVVVHAHTVSEAVSGCLLGLLVAGGFIWHARRVVELVVSHLLVFASMGGLLLMLSAEPVPTEQWMTRLALFLSGRAQAFSRADWEAAPHLAPHLTP